MAHTATEPPTGLANLAYATNRPAGNDQLRSNMDAAEYQHVVLGLIFLTYISDSFEERHQYLSATTARLLMSQPLTLAEE